ncbi:MAG: virulence RhuM family protein [Oscillospiraceae bacterium]
MNKNEIVLFETQDNEIRLEVPVEQETVWLNRQQMAELFGRDVKTISKHINNALREELSDQVVVANFATTTPHGVIEGKTQTHMTEFFNLDMIISVGYRVKSKRGVEFRRWANSVLKEYIIRDYAVNEKRLNQLGEVIRVMKRAENALDTKQVLSVIEKYNTALDMLDDYDHQTMKKPEGNVPVYTVTYEECRSIIDEMKYGNDGTLFGNEKDDSFKGSIAQFIRVSVGRMFIRRWRKKQQIFCTLL